MWSRRRCSGSAGWNLAAQLLKLTAALSQRPSQLSVLWHCPALHNKKKKKVVVCCNWQHFIGLAQVSDFTCHSSTSFTSCSQVWQPVESVLLRLRKVNSGLALGGQIQVGEWTTPSQTLQMGTSEWKCWQLTCHRHGSNTTRINNTTHQKREMTKGGGRKPHSNTKSPVCYQDFYF